MLPVAHNFIRSLTIDSGATNFIWSQIEPSAAILCACFVTYRPLLRDVRVRSIFSSFSRKSASKEEASDVSRRFPTNAPADTDSEEGLIEMKGGMAYGSCPGEISPLSGRGSLAYYKLQAVLRSQM